jgi:small subunit ribosomal protein S6e
MKFNISDPTTGGNKKIEIDEEKYIRPFFERRMGTDIDGDVMGDDYKGYIFRITGGNDRQGFTMKQGILIAGRSRILFKKRGTTFRPRRTGERKRKSVRGCITGPDLAVIALRIIKHGDKPIEGVTTVDFPNRLGRKRKNRICRDFALDKKIDDVKKYVVTRKIEKGDKTFYKSPKIQRMISVKRLRRKSVHNRDKLRSVKATAEKTAAYE